MASRAPSRANRSAVASPMPEVPPVMRATCWFRRMRFGDNRGGHQGTRRNVLGESWHGSQVDVAERHLHVTPNPETGARSLALLLTGRRKAGKLGPISPG